MFLSTTFYILGLLFVVNIGSSNLLQKIISVTHILQPALYLIYKVNLTDFQQYIDPRFTVATFNGNAHIVICFTNESAYYAGLPSSGSLIPGFQGIDIYTIVEYNNKLRREELSTVLKNLLATLLCEPYSYSPYGCYQMNEESTVSLNNQSGLYHFYSTANISRTMMLAEVNVTVNFHSNKTIDSNNINTLGGFYLSPQNNLNAVQSLYQREGNSITNSLPIATAMLNDLFYTQVFECTIQSLNSNYIQATIGPIQGLENEQNPVMCLYTPYAAYNVTIAVPMIVG